MSDSSDFLSNLASQALGPQAVRVADPIRPRLFTRFEPRAGGGELRGSRPSVVETLDEAETGDDRRHRVANARRRKGEAATDDAPPAEADERRSLATISLAAGRAHREPLPARDAEGEARAHGRTRTHPPENDAEGQEEAAQGASVQPVLEAPRPGLQVAVADQGRASSAPEKSLTSATSGPGVPPIPAPAAPPLPVLQGHVIVPQIRPATNAEPGLGSVRRALEREDAAPGGPAESAADNSARQDAHRAGSLQGQEPAGDGPVIQVTIGRVEVRATTAGAGPRGSRGETPSGSGHIGLDEYLRKRGRGNP